MTHSVLAVDLNVIVAHTPLASETTLENVDVVALLCVAASGAAHLVALVEDSGAVRCCGCRRALTELAVDQVVMSVVTSVGNGGIVCDTCPDGGQRQEDAEASDHQSTNLGHLVKDGLVELESRQDSYVSLAITMWIEWVSLPGMVIVWQPIMKTICIGPNCSIFRRRR